MFKSILEIGSAFDWISPFGSLIGDVLNGPSHTFLIPQECGYSGREIAGLLKRRGVGSWGHMIVQGTIMISVRQAQASRAERLLDEAGIATEGAAEDEGEAGELRWPAFETLEELGEWWEL